MNASNAFRSHLMQQFVAAARTQSRPPLALIGLTKEEDRIAPSPPSPAASSNTVETRTPPLARRYGTDRKNHNQLLTFPPTSPSRSSSSTDSRAAYHPLLPRGSDDAVDYPSALPQQRRLLSSISLDEQEDRRTDDDITPPQSGKATANQELDVQTALFQNLLQTRRTSSRFAPRQLVKEDDGGGNRTASSADNLVTPVLLRDQAYWIQALDRAVECGLTAPNHKRTEPFRFKRMLAPSAATKRLAEIAYEVNLLEQKKKKGGASTREGAATNAMEQAAARKRDKWSQIPAFLVTLVESSQDMCNKDEAVEDDEAETLLLGCYDPLPYVPPRTERELEDYAAACAAVQNILLSLHAEHIASKWVTGTVVRTTAFRHLVQAGPQDRVVALIMLGEPLQNTRPIGGSNHQPRRRRRHKPLEVVLQDLD